MCCCYCKSRFSKFPLISGVTKTLSNMVKKFEVNRTISKFSIICSLETFINQRDQTFLARSIRARITREKFLHVQKNVNIHTVKSVKSIRNILWLTVKSKFLKLLRQRLSHFVFDAFFDTLRFTFDTSHLDFDTSPLDFDAFNFKAF